jgi:lysylphosphatidylglycerol synthetase-like protein (DUF2156 family)
MEYLFSKLLLAKKEQGFSRFNLGMAPMAGFQEREEFSLEERAVHTFMKHLRFLFNYEGLRAYKAKFATVWEPRYLVYRNVLNLPLVALAIMEVSELRDGFRAREVARHANIDVQDHGSRADLLPGVNGRRMTGKWET